MSRVATVDIGTNSVLLLVAEYTENAWHAVLERATVTRLGQGVDRTRTLHPDAIARTIACLSQYADEARRAGVGQCIVVGTSAMRDASGADVLRAYVRDAFGTEVRVLSGNEEARATYTGARSGLDIDAECTVFDIGGGSTEFVVGGASGPVFSHSFDVGAVRMTERHIRHDPPTRHELESLERDVRARFAEHEVPACGPILGVAGTVTTLCAWLHGVVPYDGAKVHGQRITRAEIARAYATLASMPLAQRGALGGLDPKRADVIVAGAAITLACLDILGGTELVASDRGVRWGLLSELGEAQPRARITNPASAARSDPRARHSKL